MITAKIKKVYKYTLIDNLNLYVMTVTNNQLYYI